MRTAAKAAPRSPTHPSPPGERQEKPRTATSPCSHWPCRQRAPRENAAAPERWTALANSLRVRQEERQEKKRQRRQPLDAQAARAVRGATTKRRLLANSLRERSARRSPRRRTTSPRSTAELDAQAARTRENAAAQQRTAANSLREKRNEKPAKNDDESTFIHIAGRTGHARREKQLSLIHI